MAEIKRQDTTTVRHINSQTSNILPFSSFSPSINQRPPTQIIVSRDLLLHSAGDSDVCVESKTDFLKPSSKTVATRSSSFWTDALMKWGRPEERDILATFHVDDDELTCVTSESLVT